MKHLIRHSLLAAAGLFSSTTAHADTKLDLTVLDSSGAPVAAGSVIIERDGQVPVSMPFSKGQLKTLVKGEERFHLSVHATAANLRPAYLNSLSAHKPGQEQKISVELRSMNEPAINARLEESLLEHVEELLSKARPVQPIPFK